MHHTNKLARRIATACAATSVAVMAMACGGSAKSSTGPETPAEAASPSQDLVFDKYQPASLEGNVFQPEGLGRPGMVRMAPKKKPTIDAQKKTYAKATGPAKVTEGQILATLYYDAGKDAKDDDAKAKAAYDEARKVLQEVYAAANGQADLITLQMLSALELANGDYAAGAKLFQELVTRFPEDKSAANSKAWLANSYLRLGQTAEATKAIEGFAPAADDATGNYVVAWVNFKNRNYDVAKKSIAAALKAWKSEGTRQAVERDFVLINARGGASIDEAAETLATYGDTAKQYGMFYKLHEAYFGAGDYEKASAALDKASAVIAAAQPPVDAVVFRFRQAQYALKLNRPDLAAEASIDAQAKVAACDDTCKKNNAEPIATNLGKLASSFHTVYATTADERYYEPAKKLYAAYLALPDRPDTEQVRGYADQLETTKKNAQPGAGKHEAEILKGFLSPLRDEGIVACYESVLQGDTALKGSLKLTLNIDDKGAVTGAQTDPPSGAAGLAAVGKCVEEKVKGWTFPGRSLQGLTAVVFTYNLAPKGA